MNPINEEDEVVHLEVSLPSSRADY